MTFKEKIMEWWIRPEMYYTNDIYVFFAGRENILFLCCTPPQKKRLDCFRLKSIFFDAALKYDSFLGYWWNEACFAAIDAWTCWGPSDEIKDSLNRLQDTKHKVEIVRTNKKLVRTAKLFFRRASQLLIGSEWNFFRNRIIM